MTIHRLELTTVQANKLYALTGDIEGTDQDMRDIRNQLSNSLGESAAYEHYQAEFSRPTITIEKFE